MDYSPVAEQPPPQHPYCCPLPAGVHTLTSLQSTLQRWTGLSALWGCDPPPHGPPRLATWQSPWKNRLQISNVLLRFTPNKNTHTYIFFSSLSKVESVQIALVLDQFQLAKLLLLVNPTIMRERIFINVFKIRCLHTISFR